MPTQNDEKKMATKEARRRVAEIMMETGCTRRKAWNLLCKMEPTAREAAKIGHLPA